MARAATEAARAARAARAATEATRATRAEMAEMEMGKHMGKTMNVFQVYHNRRHKRIGSSNNNTVDLPGFLHKNSKFGCQYMAQLQN